MERLTNALTSRDGERNVFYFMKGFACICVIFIHVRFPGLIGTVVWKLSQFAVPIFLMISGYFAFEKNVNVIRKRLYKILKIFAWSYAVYFCYKGALHIAGGTFVEWIMSIFTKNTVVKYLVFCNIDFAIALWYLLAIAETYFVWFFVVKFRKEGVALKVIPILFLARVVLSMYCDLHNLPWTYKTNFLTGAMPFFLFGYFLKKNENFFRSVPSFFWFFSFLLGAVTSVVPEIVGMRLNFSCIGNIIYSVAIFVMSVKIPNKSYGPLLEYVGKNLSLDVYIFHMIIYEIISIITFRFIKIDPQNALWGWLCPVLVVVMTIAFAQLFKVLKGKILMSDMMIKR